MKHIVRLAPVLLFGLLVAVQTRAQTSPVIVSTQGYINGTALTSHTSGPFNTVGASTLVAFVSTNTPWNGLPVSIGGLTDNAGNTWNVLTSPSTWVGSQFTLVSAIYYVNAPITSATETVTVNLSNAAPLVFHIFAVSGADITGPPISSAITNPGVGGTSAVVTTAPIAVPTDSLLLSWVKNETSATATAVAPYTLDAQSTSFLWAESQAPISAGSYSGQFQYSSAIGWQAAIVGLKPLTGPEAASQAVTTKFNTPVNITLTGISPQGFPLTYSVVTGPTAGALSGTPPNLTYTPATGYFGHDSFTFNVNDGTTNSNTATVSITVQGSVDVVSTTGYINGTPQTTHTSAAFNTIGSSTLVAFVSSHPSWNSLPVSISGLSDSAGNSWSLLTGPTQFVGSQFTLLSAVYYVNAPITSAAETVTVNLTNAAPLALHVFAVSGADITGPPISSAITSPAAGHTSASVTTAPIAVPTNSLLLSWVKNETSATATALGGYTLDAQSTSFLWAEFETAFSSSTYTGQFQYNSAIGWQTAIVGLKPPGSVVQPVLTATPANPTDQTNASFSFTDTQTGVSFLCQLDGSAFSPCTSPTSYSGLTVGSHTFSAVAQDTSNNQSAAVSFTWVITAPPPAPTITSTPTNPTIQTSATLSFTDTQAGVTFLCQLDGSAFSSCSSPASYSGLTVGGHTFSVIAQDTAGDQSTAASFTWTITTPPPTPTITAKPANPTSQISASFSFTDRQGGVSFVCQLDGSLFSPCTSPTSYSGLSLASHTFSVKAQDTAGNLSTAASFSWTIQAVVTPVIVSTQGYINGTALTSHTSTAFNTIGASTLVAFVSTNTPWNGLPVSISGLTDNAGNTWNVLTGPNTWVGSSSTLLSAIYYVNAPISSATETVTVNLSNAAPLVFHVFAVSGADISGPPISSAITNPGLGGTSSVVTTAPIAVLTDSLLLSWVKNDTSATATALGGYTLDAQSTSFLWAESQAPISAGSYSGQFQYSSAIGWQTAIVGLKPLTGPEAASQAVTTKFNAPVNITLTGISPQGFPLTYSVVTGPTAGALSGTPPNLTYTPATGYLGHDSFTFNVNDGTTNSNTATVSITVQGSVDVVSTTGYINGTSQTTHTSAAFNTIGSSTLVAFVSSHPSWNSLPVSISGLSDSAGNSWSLLTGPTQFVGSQFTLLSAVYYVNAPITSAAETVTVNLTNAAPLALHVFAVSGADITGPPISSAITSPAAGHTSASVTTAPIAVPTDSLLLSWAKNETSATATALGGYTLDAQSTSFLWAEFKTAFSSSTYTGQFQYNSAIGWQTAIVGLKPPGSVVQPVLTATPANPTNQTSASFSFKDTQTGVSFLCQLDGSAFSPCTSPASYSGLGLGSHTFSVKAQDASLNQSATVNFTWNVEAVIIAFDQVAAATPQSSTATVSVSFPATQSVGDLNIVVVGWNDTTSSVQSVNDSAGNTYNLAIGPTIGTALQQSIYYSANIVGGSNTVTVTFNQAAAFPDVRVLEYRGVTTLDVTAGASGNSAAANSGSATTTSAYELIFGADMVGTTTAAAGSGFTSRIITGDGDIAEDKMVTTAGSNSATATLSSAAPWVMQMATFSFSPGPAPTVSGVSPNAGPTTGGTTVTISGTNFVTGATVTFGGTPATNVQVVLGTQITATTPAGSAGAATVTVSNPGGRNGSLNSGFTYLVPPTLSAVSPNNGPIAGGTPVTIAGTNFVGGATVNFGANAATNVVVVSATQITATTPAGTAGAVTVEVTNSSGLSGSLTNGFTYGPPTVSSISPNNGPAAGGTAVTITGTRFTTGATVAFGTAAATSVVVVSATKIAATTPASAAGAVAVTVTDPGGQSGSLTNGFIYGPPTVSSVSPNNGPAAGGTAVTITGTSFATGATVTFGGTAATNVVVASATRITATTPAGTAGSVTVTVTNTDGLSGGLNNGFIYDPPTVSNVSPNTGPTAGGTPVTISGTNFPTGATVTFGTAAAKNVVVVSATQITATTPAGTAGAVTVTVTDSGGQNGSLANGFTYAVVPTISSISPNNGSTAGGTAVTITGTNFAAGATVTFGGAAATNVTVVSVTQITATTPAGAAGSVTVTVTNSGNLSGSLNSGFTYGSPTVSGVSPNTGSAAGGTTVTITGTNFFGGATVTFGSTAATNVLVVSATKITATTPTGAVGAVTVTVTDSGGQSGSLANGFTYAVVPTISSISPNNGSTAGGTAVTITGTNFAAGATVAFGTTAATSVTVVSATQITATTPAATAGAVTVTVTIPSGQTGSLSNGFTYLPPVTIALGQVAAATPQAPTATVAVTFPGAQSAGNMNIVVVGWNDTTSSVQSVNDSAGNTYNLAIGPTIGTALQQSIYYSANIVGGSNTVTVTFNQAAAFLDVRVLEYRGVTTLDVTAGASGNSAAANSGSATTTRAYELIFGADTVFTTTGAAGSGFTSRIITGDGDIAEDKTATTAGSNSATATLSSAGPWIMQMVTFK